jgi:uncharacterized protein YndB with AHSA1/START domain
MSDATPEGVVSASSDAGGVKIVRIFDAPREEVFDAWIVPERFANWFGERGSSLPLDKLSMDVRPGGAWSAVMIYGPDKIEIPFSGHYREVMRPERLVLTMADPTGVESDRVELLTVVLEDIDEGRTRMTFTQTGGNLPADEYSRAMAGELIFLERLGEELKARHDI